MIHSSFKSETYIDPKDLKKFLSYDSSTGIMKWEKLPYSRGAGCVKPGATAGKSKDKYGKVQFRKKTLASHRVAWALHFGKWPKSEIDHINGIRHDNRIENLRSVSRTGNNRNKLRHRSGKLLGAVHYRGAWHSHVNVAGKTKYLGTFRSELAAHEAARPFLRSA